MFLKLMIHLKAAVVVVVVVPRRVLESAASAKTVGPPAGQLDTELAMHAADAPLFFFFSIIFISLKLY